MGERGTARGPAGCAGGGARKGRESRAPSERAQLGRHPRGLQPEAGQRQGQLVRGGEPRPARLLSRVAYSDGRGRDPDRGADRGRVWEAGVALNGSGVELRRSPRRPAGGSARRRTTDHSVSRLLRRADHGAGRPDSEPRVCGAGPHVSFSGSALFAAGRRAGDRGAGRDTRVRPRGLPLCPGAAARSRRDACLAEVLADDAAAAVPCPGAERSDEEPGHQRIWAQPACSSPSWARAI